MIAAATERRNGLLADALQESGEPAFVDVNGIRVEEGELVPAERIK